MSYCEKCLHNEVCGAEGCYDEALKFCDDFINKDDKKVSIGVLEQVMWERDVAIDQLKELGYELGQKIEKLADDDLPDYLTEEGINKKVENFGKTVKFVNKMLKECRDTTPEERESVDKYVESISTPTGVTFDGDRAVSLIDRIKDLANTIEIDECSYWTPTRIANQLKRWCENG